MEPESIALKDALVRYEIASASQRLERDRLVACWRDIIHNAMMEIPPNYTLLHQVMDSMDQYLKREKH